MSLLDLDDTTFEPHNLRQIFLAVEKTYNWDLPLPSDLSAYPFTTVYYNLLFKLDSLKASDIQVLHTTLSKDQALFEKFLTAKIGYDYEVEGERAKAIKLY